MDDSTLTARPSILIDVAAPLQKAMENLSRAMADSGQEFNLDTRSALLSLHKTWEEAQLKIQRLADLASMQGYSADRSEREYFMH